MTLRKKLFENIVGKGENAGDQHFLLFPQCFIPFQRQISIFESHFFSFLQIFLIWTSLKFCRLVKRKLFTTQSRLSTTLRKKPFENNLGKEENAYNQHFLIFLQCFLPFLTQISIFESHLFCHLQILSIWTGL